MAKISRVTWEKIRVFKSEEYGLFGEPGNRADWKVFFNVLVGGKKKKGVLWERDEVRDDRTYPIDPQMDVSLDGELSIDIWGWESDSTSGLDNLPSFKRTHTPEPGWETGGTSYRKYLSAHAFKYEVHYNVKYISEGATLTPGHGTLFDTRYSGLWDASSERRFSSLGRTAAQVKAKADKIWGEGGRFAQLQPYVQGNKILYNVIWTFSGIRQLWNLDCDEAHFVKTTGETWSWVRPHQVIPFVVSGQVRYSCLWNAGQHAQLWHPNCSESEARKLGDDNWSWGRAHQIQPFFHNNQRRYSFLWNAGQYGQLWNINCDRQQVAINTKDTSSWARPRQIFAST
jgi:hypothetical protein